MEPKLQETTRPTPEAPRREFLKSAAALGAGAAIGFSPPERAENSQVGNNVPSDAIPQRVLGSTGIRVSALGFGGHHIGDIKTVGEAIRLIQQAIKAGVNFFDNAWEYYNGRTEEWLGQALKGRRQNVFLMTKVCTHGRTDRLAMRMLEQSLRR